MTLTTQNFHGFFFSLLQLGSKKFEDADRQEHVYYVINTCAVSMLLKYDYYPQTDDAIYYAAGQ